MNKFIFPSNYKYSNKFLGIIEYKFLLPLSIYASIIFFILYISKINFFWAFGIFIVLVIPPAILISVGVQGESVIPFLICVYKFKRNSRIYLYNHNKFV